MSLSCVKQYTSCGKQYTELDEIVQFCRSRDDVIFTAANQYLGPHLPPNSCPGVKYKPIYLTMHIEINSSCISYVRRKQKCNNQKVKTAKNLLTL